MGTEKRKIKETVVIVERDARTGKLLRTMQVGPNIVTDHGDLYYAQRGAAETPDYTYNVGQMVVASGVAAGAVKSATFGLFKNLNSTYTGRQDFDAGYPKTDDSDTDNTGRTADAITYKRTYTTGQANYTVTAIGICRPGGVTTASVASLRRLLNYKTLSAAQQVTKTSAITLTVYVNHLFDGS